MTARSEIAKCTVWTLIVGAVLVPTALVLGSGHASTGFIVALVAVLFLLPSSLTWDVVGASAGPVVGGIAAAIAQFLWIFLWVYLVRRITVNRKRRVTADAR
jgi:cell division protein FtsW (lipid II flippase)